MDEDDRFKHLASDPKFKVLKKNQRKVQIDERFQSMFTDKKFTSSSDNLKRFYNIKDDEKVRDDDENDDDEQSESESSSDESESGTETEVEDDVLRIKFHWQPLDHDAETAEISTRRLAIQNLDWDKIDVKDIFTLVKSVRMPLNVRIYISEYGKERLAKEEVEGPQELIEMPNEEEIEEEYQDLRDKMKAITNVGPKTYRVNEYEDADEQLDLKNEELRERVRAYQLNRMRYYYAIAEFDSIESAELVYKELDGLEYEGSSVELDLRFVPDDVEFDVNDMKAECDQVPDLASYKAPQFISSALQQTTVNFTWDQTDTKREEQLRRAYTKDELEKDDLEAYLASETESEDEEDEEGGQAAESTTMTPEARMIQYQKLLKELKEEEDKKDAIDVDVEWNAGDDDDEMSQASDDDEVSQASDDDDNSRGVNDDENDSEEPDDTNESDCDDIASSNDEKSEEDEEESTINEPAPSKVKEPLKKKSISNDEHIDFFDDVGDKEEFKFNPDDDRFKAIYESDLYNIDPSRPNFKRTKAFEEIAERKRKKRTRD